MPLCPCGNPRFGRPDGWTPPSPYGLKTSHRWTLSGMASRKVIYEGDLRLTRVLVWVLEHEGRASWLDAATAGARVRPGLPLLTCSRLRIADCG
jgi:hypothetical protein